MKQYKLFSHKFEMVIVEDLPDVNYLPYNSNKIETSDSMYNYLKKNFYQTVCTKAKEHFICVALSRANQVIGYNLITIGGRHATLVDTAIVAKFLLDCQASAFIISHNHPSGKLGASEADIDVTKKLKKAMSLFDIQLLDHIIYTEQDYYSFANNGISF